MSDSQPTCPPPMNTDVSGIGVRISFYLQALFLSLLSARSGSLDEITDSLYTLVATNMAMAVTSLILGFKKNPEISLQDGLIVFYLLAMSWVAVFFSLPSYNRFIRSDNVLKYLSVFQSYLLFAFALALLVKGPSFGITPKCNSEARVVIFRPFNALHGGRVVGWITVSVALTFYSFLTISDYLPTAKEKWKNSQTLFRNLKKKLHERRNPPAVGAAPAGSPVKEAKTDVPDLEANQSRPKRTSRAAQESTFQEVKSPVPTEKEDEKARPTQKKNKKSSRGERSSRHTNGSVNETHTSTFDLGISGTLIIEIIVVFVLWSLAVMNTELLIRWNSFAPSDQSQWQFGQVLPMFLIVLPLVNLVKAFREYKLHRRPHRRKVHRNGKKRQDHRRGLHPGAPSEPFGRAEAGAFPGRRRPGAGHPSFPFGGPGMDPFGDLLGGGGFPFQRPRDPRGNLDGARISAQSLHSDGSAKEEENTDDSSSSSSDGEAVDRQEGPSSIPLRT